MNERGRWITLDNGNHIFIYPGQSVSDYFRNRGKPPRLMKTVPKNLQKSKSYKILFKDEDEKEAFKVRMEELDKKAKQAKEETKDEYLRKFTNEVFEDVTDEWKLKHPQKPEITEDDFVTIDGTEYRKGDLYIDGKPVKFVEGFSNEAEKEDAKILSRELGGTVRKLPKIDYPLGYRNPDYLQEQKHMSRFIEQKAQGKNSKSENGMWNAIRRGENQSDIIAIDLRNRKYSTSEILGQVKKTFEDENTSFVKTVIVIKNGKQIWRIFTKREKNGKL